MRRLRKKLGMTRLAIFSVALVSIVMLASPSSAEWTEVAQSIDGDTFYIHYDSMKENKGYLYYWTLSDYLKPTKGGTSSVRALRKVDCQTPRKYQFLSYIFYDERMGSGSGNTVKGTSNEWDYPTPDGVDELLINMACDYVGK